jgi:DNA-binding transcriptional LysR family regulator
MAQSTIDRFKEVSFSQLRTFCECVRQGTYAAAARTLHLSQPAVWQQVRALERLAGVPLLERHGRALRLTEDGRILWEQAHTVLGNVESLWTTFNERRQVLPRSLTIIATPAILSEELARPVAAFQQAHQDILLHLQSQHGLPALDWLTRGDADMAIVPADVLLIADHAQFCREQLGQRVATLIVRKQDRLARRRKLELGDLIQTPLILPLEDNHWFVQVQAILRTHDLADRLRPAIRVGHILTAQTLVALGVGPALMPMPEHGSPPAGLIYRKLDHLLPSLPLYLLTRRGVNLRPHVRQFIEVVRSYMNSCRRTVLP